MAVPFTGALSLKSIAREKRFNNYNSTSNAGLVNISLTNMSNGTQFGLINSANSSANRPNGATPHSMAEWYQYDHDKTNITTPSVSTGTISQSSGIISMIGNVGGTGGASITARGHVASSSTTSPTITNKDFQTTHPSNTTGQYTTTKSSGTLLVGPSGTTFYFRAYATNSQGTAYGTTRSFLVTSQGQI